jgi:ubiquinone/menaquinone biosynthesis C-methylase UbiE
MTTPNESERAGAYPETADIHTSSEAYAGRFAGAAGAWMLDVQERLTRAMLEDYPGVEILDVGGGHGQLAVPLARAGHPVTVLGSDDSCRRRIQSELDAGRCRFLVGNVVELPFEDNSFDTVLCFRLVTHCAQWPRLIRELCRVARRAVIVDYPTSQSVNVIAPALFGAKKKVEKNTRTWTLFRHRQIHQAFAEGGFVLHRADKQFFLPMALHRILKSRALSAGLEGVCRALGLTALWGSPVIVEMRPKQ